MAPENGQAGGGSGDLPSQDVDLNSIEGLEDIDALDGMSKESFDDDALAELMPEYKPKKEELDHEQTSLKKEDLKQEGTAEKLARLLKGESEDDGKPEGGENAENDEQPEGDSDEVTYEVNGKKLTLEQLISGNMMQDDFTRKTQELAEERKATEEFKKGLEEQRQGFDEEIQKTRETYAQELSQKQSYDRLFNMIQAKNPDLYAELEAEFTEMTATDNPMVNAEIAALRQELAALKAGVTESGDSAKIAEFTNEWVEASKEIIPMFKELGVTVDQSEVRALWAKDMTVKQAIQAKYGEILHKAMKSKQAVLKAKASASRSKKPGMGGNARGNGGKKSYKDFGNMNQMINSLAGMITKNS
jgi:hypothetical protein